MIKKNKKTVAILGATGMLGNALYASFKDKYNLLLVVRDLNKIKLLERAHDGTKRHRIVIFDVMQLLRDLVTGVKYPSEHALNFFKALDNADYIINAIGVTIPSSRQDPAATLFINGTLPHLLAEQFGPKLIHITTDCVYDGVRGFPYNERSPKSPVDLYGISKSIGEPTNCLTLRTSIIGRELEGRTGLLEWFLQQKGKTINGFSKHLWSGITTNEFANVCDKIISKPKNFPRSGLYHIFSEPISKYDLLKLLHDHYKIDCAIKRDADQKINRTLATNHDLNACLKIPSHAIMVSALK